MAKKLGKKQTPLAEAVAYWAALYNLDATQEANLRSFMHEYGMDIGAEAHSSVRAKLQVVGPPKLGDRDRWRSEWFMEAALAIREGRWAEELQRRREKIAKSAKLEAAQAKNRAKKEAAAARAPRLQ